MLALPLNPSCNLLRRSGNTSRLFVCFLIWRNTAEELGSKHEYEVLGSQFSKRPKLYDERNAPQNAAVYHPARCVHIDTPRSDPNNLFCAPACVVNVVDKIEVEAAAAVSTSRAFQGQGRLTSVRMD